MGIKIEGSLSEAVSMHKDYVDGVVVEAVRATHRSLKTPAAQGGLTPVDTGKLIEGIKGNGLDDADSVALSYLKLGEVSWTSEEEYFEYVDRPFASPQAPAGISEPAAEVFISEISRREND